MEAALSVLSPKLRDKRHPVCCLGRLRRSATSHSRIVQVSPFKVDEGCSRNTNIAPPDMSNQAVWMYNTPGIAEPDVLGLQTQKTSVNAKKDQMSGEADYLATFRLEGPETRYRWTTTREYLSSIGGGDSSGSLLAVHKRLELRPATSRRLQLTKASEAYVFSFKADSMAKTSSRLPVKQ